MKGCLCGLVRRFGEGARHSLSHAPSCPEHHDRGPKPMGRYPALHAEPVEGPAGDPQVPPEQGDPRAPTVPAPPPTEPMSDQEEP